MLAKCPVCDASMTLSNDVEIAELVTCSECKTSLEVTGKEKNSVTVKEAPKVEEDWGE